MKYGNITLEKRDFVYLKGILNVSGFENNRETRESLAKLETELKTAIVLDEAEMPADVIRFNSRISLVVDGSSKVEMQLVKPQYKDLKTNKISILTPMGVCINRICKGRSGPMGISKWLKKNYHFRSRARKIIE